MSDKTTYLTDEGYKKLKDELEHLKNIKRIEIAGRIKEAKELGDLSENAEYADAREEQSFVEGRILEIEDALKNAQVISGKDSEPDRVRSGSVSFVFASPPTPAGSRSTSQTPRQLMRWAQHLLRHPGRLRPR